MHHPALAGTAVAGQRVNCNTWAHRSRVHLVLGDGTRLPLNCIGLPVTSAHGSLAPATRVPTRLTRCVVDSAHKSLYPQWTYTDRTYFQAGALRHYWLSCVKLCLQPSGPKFRSDRRLPGLARRVELGTTVTATPHRINNTRARSHTTQDRLRHLTTENPQPVPRPSRYYGDQVCRATRRNRLPLRDASTPGRTSEVHQPPSLTVC